MNEAMRRACRRTPVLNGTDELAYEWSQAVGFAEVRTVRANAESIRRSAQLARLGVDVENCAAEVRLRAERRLGQMFELSFLHGGDRRSESKRRLRLADLRVTRNESSRWRRIAAVSDSEFEKYLTGAKRRGERITSADLLRLAQMLNNGRPT
jgi:hypothetical protein